MRVHRSSLKLRLEAIATLVRASDFKSDGMRRETHPAGSIPVRFRQQAHDGGKLMTEGSPVVVHFKDLPSSERVRTVIESRCEQFASEFQEVMRFEITLTQMGTDVEAHGHATGKNTNVVTQASGKNPRAAADQVLDKIEKQLRKIHDKRIFAQRREAQRNPPKRVPSE